MRSSSLRVLILLIVGAVPALAQQAPVASAPSVTAPAASTVEEIVKRAAQSENTIISNLKSFKPIVEVYLQNVVPDETQAATPTQDTYVLGRFNWRNGPGSRC